MANQLVFRRIEEWEAAGLVDPATAARLREAEANAATEVGPDEPAVRGPGRLPTVTAVELFAYLGAAFLLGAWYALVASLAPRGQPFTTWSGPAGLVAAAALATAGIALARRDPRSRRAAGVALLAALPNLGFGVFQLAGALHPEAYPDPPANALAASIVTLVAAFTGRGFLPGLPTQLGLAASAAATGGIAMGWLDAVLFPRGGEQWAPRPIDEMAALVRVLLSMAWWWLVAAAMALMAVLLDPRPRTEGRTRLGRIAVGATAVLGTTSAVFIRHDWVEGSALAGEPVLAPWAGAAMILAVSGVLVALAVKRLSVGYLWPGGLGVFIALTWLNAEYLAVESGLWVALLAEAIVLFGVAFGVNRLGRTLRRAGPGTVAA